MIFDIPDIDISRSISHGCTKATLTCHFQIHNEFLTLTRNYRILRSKKETPRAECHHTLLRFTSDGPLSQEFHDIPTNPISFLLKHINPQWLTTNHITTRSLPHLLTQLLALTENTEQTLLYASELMHHNNLPFRISIRPNKRGHDLIFTNTQTGGTHTPSSLSRHETTAASLCLSTALNRLSETHLTLLLVDLPLDSYSLIPELLQTFRTILPLFSW
jgi:hypothetical protein